MRVMTLWHYDYVTSGFALNYGRWSLHAIFIQLYRNALEFVYNAAITLNKISIQMQINSASKEIAENKQLLFILMKTCNELYCNKPSLTFLKFF